MKTKCDFLLLLSILFIIPYIGCAQKLDPAQTGISGSAAPGHNGTIHSIGEHYGGGIVFYVFDDLSGVQHGLIAATTDQGSAIAWYPGTCKICTDYLEEGGNVYTDMIVAAGSQGKQEPFAARTCRNYSVTIAGVSYEDWYLPSKKELNLLYLQKDIVGGFVCSHHDYYWSSSEYNGWKPEDACQAYLQFFSNGSSSFGPKKHKGHVRAIRAF